MITILCFALPLSGFVLSVISGAGIKFGGLIAIGVFSLLGFYMLRLALWNHRGEEIIRFRNDEISYIADYRYFRDGKKSIRRNEISYSVCPVGYEEENVGVLIISNGESEIASVVKMPRNNIEKLIELLENAG
ncbi:hypothetical protein HZF10_06255 [Flavobacterium sp. MAH-1]|uniref:Uncharacterized protein n=1 Tax=Flavobacterium agri TaxID=2743471 RepID=A0A7Y9C4S0_9FLAO|nr:hypothetical protein [Flavobacterium agri]